MDLFGGGKVLICYAVVNGDEDLTPSEEAVASRGVARAFEEGISLASMLAEILASEGMPENTSITFLYGKVFLKLNHEQLQQVIPAASTKFFAKLIRPSVARDLGEDVDLTYMIREKVSQPVQILPDIGELATFLGQPPADDLRFPVPTDWFSKLPDVNRGKIFRRAVPLEERCFAIIPLIKVLVDPPVAMETEDTFHHLWDALINDSIKFFFMGGTWVHVRNRSGEGTSGILRPDIYARLGVYALWRGEEKGPNTSGDPAEELISKLDWTYGSSIPYLLAYYAREHIVTFCAICVNMSGRKFRRDLKMFNIQIDSDRVELVIACLNVARLLPILQKLCYSSNAESDVDIVQRPSGKRIEFYGRKAVKMINAESFGRVRSIYRELASEPRCPYSEVLLHDREETCSLAFERGLRKSPTTEVELITCVSCICKALVWLHGRELMHRDIRWENVVKSTTGDSWFLVDFDEAERSPCPSALVLNKKTHAPEMTAGCHDIKVDIWGVGHLLSTTDVVLGSSLKELRDSCLSSNPSQRPMAEECLARLEANLATSC